MHRNICIFVRIRKRKKKYLKIQKWKYKKMKMKRNKELLEWVGKEMHDSRNAHGNCEEMLEMVCTVKYFKQFKNNLKRLLTA